ncbi:hypothetical protein UFOVP188_34 [uncultured Caudovirales phage]|uniref:Uncharacterized protein n=1 Tax=uncultured Caudovirales phage TaxID=2100421 RepID=A0A6J7WF24_9CAUD|nr:hypothetical protein UFOVP188_34 [uncultured Caudovirales phage]
MAKACATAIREGTELYKSAKESFMEVKSSVDEAIGVANEVKGFWAKLFGAKTKPVAQTTRKKEKFVAVDETKVMSDIVAQLSNFFRLQEQLAAHIREEEEKSRNVYDPDVNLMEAALKRTMAMDQMALLEVEIREAMVYQAPPEMGALWSKTNAMRDVIAAEQQKARKKRDAEAWLRKEQERLQREKVTYLVISILFLLYLWMLILFLGKIGKT